MTVHHDAWEGIYTENKINFAAGPQTTSKFNWISVESIFTNLGSVDDAKE